MEFQTMQQLLCLLNTWVISGDHSTKYCVLYVAGTDDAHDNNGDNDITFPIKRHKIVYLCCNSIYKRQVKAIKTS